MSQSVRSPLETKNKLKEAGKKVIFDKGFHDARISDITAEAGVAHGTFYLYFRSKEELLLELLEDVKEEMLALIDRGIEEIGRGNVAEGKKLLFIYPFQKMLEEKELSKIFFFEAICLSGRFKEFYIEGKNTFFVKTQTALSLLGVENPSVIATLLLSTGRSLVEDHILSGREVERIWQEVLSELGLYP